MNTNNNNDKSIFMIENYLALLYTSNLFEKPVVHRRINFKF